MSNKNEKTSTKTEIKLTDEQRKAIEKAFGPEIAKKVDSIVITQAGSGIVSMLVVN